MCWSFPKSPIDLSFFRLSLWKSPPGITASSSCNAKQLPLIIFNKYPGGRNFSLSKVWVELNKDKVWKWGFQGTTRQFTSRYGALGEAPNTSAFFRSCKAVNFQGYCGCKAAFIHYYHGAGERWIRIEKVKMTQIVPSLSRFSHFFWIYIPKICAKFLLISRILKKLLLKILPLLFLLLLRSGFP